MSNSVNKIPSNYFNSGMTVAGGIVTDTLLVNGVSITSGSGVTLNTDINVGTTTSAAASSITAQLKSKNDTQDATLATNTAQITELRAAMDGVYGGTALSWIGLGTLAFASGSQFVAKSGSTMTGDLALGTNNIQSIRDIKFSNAIMGGTLSNIYCSNVIASNITGTHTGDGSQLTNIPTASAANFGTTNPGSTIVGNAGRFTTINGFVNSFTMTASGDITNGRNFISSNAVMTNNVYCTGNVVSSGNVMCAVGSFFLGDGSKLTGVVASGADATSATNICTVPTSGTTLNIGTNLTAGSTVNMGNASSTPAVNVNGGNLALLGTGTVKLDGTSTSIQTVTTGSVFINKLGSSTTTTVYGRTAFNQAHTVNPIASHNLWQSGVMQTMVIPLSGEQGPITLTTGTALPLVQLRAPYNMNIFGARMSCVQTSTSGGFAVDVRVYPQATTINGTNVNWNTGTSIFTIQGIYVDQGLYSSIGSTGVVNNGQLVSSPSVFIGDDSIIGLYCFSTGTNVLGAKLTLYYTF
jgi:hypothetical protein